MTAVEVIHALGLGMDPVKHPKEYQYLCELLWTTLQI